jgi:predicted ATP-binding protein involved in virulence
MRIAKVEVENIGVFEDISIEFKEKINPDLAEIHIITGENGTGKTTLLYILASIFNAELLKGRISDKSFSFAIYFDNPKDFIKYDKNGFEPKYESLYHHNTEILKINNSILQYKERLNSMSILNKDEVDFKLNFAIFGYSGERKIKNHNIYTLQVQNYIPLKSVDFQNIDANKDIIYWIANIKTKEALAYKDGRDISKFQNSLQKIQNLVSNIISKKVEFVIEYEQIICVKVKVDEQVLDFDVLPDGLKSILGWIADLLMRLDRIPWENDLDVFERNIIIFLDEIDIHLHPAWQRKVLPEVQKLFRNAQIFVTTHSPFVVGSIDGAWVYRLGLENEKAKLLDVKESNIGDSVSLILDEVFGIESEFSSPFIEQELKTFYLWRNELLHKNFEHEKDFVEKAKSLAKEGYELENIIGSELRQLNRILQKSYSI